jgi:hypothetical protein
VSLKYNGKPFSEQAFTRGLMDAARQLFAEEMQKRIGAIRDHRTGEFPTVVVRGGSLDDMTVIVEASPALVEIIKGQLSEEEAGIIDFQSPSNPPPRAFLSYTTADRPVAERIATDLRNGGIDTWWAEWEIGAGDSIVAKINEGLSGCTHFVVLLTPNSINKPWVQTEMDAGFVRRVSGRAKFIALRLDLDAVALPPLLQPLHSPAIGEHYDDDIRQLVHDIHGATRKPPLGRIPQPIEQPVAPYSPAAMAVARFFCESSKDGFWFDVQTSREKISDATGLSEDDVQDALHELRNFIKKDTLNIIPENTLYAEFDTYFSDRNPSEDALIIAAALQNDPAFPEGAAEIAERLNWPPRRLNPALAYLVERKIVQDSNFIGGGKFVATRISRTDATRRFVKSRT